ncbi:MAG: PH domain-containing protein, partial [Myxococcales bacterium]|nr:PH domain-containing protein [Myxococcales bacterium]
FYGKKLTGFDAEEIPYANISSLEMGKGFMGYFISFFASGNKIKMKWIDKGDVAGLVDAVRSSRGRSSADAASTAPQADIPAQIEKLGKLRDQDLLTEDEFRDKKAELLQRM